MSPPGPVSVLVIRPKRRVCFWLAALLLGVAACAPNPRHQLALTVLDRAEGLQTELASWPEDASAACDAVGDIRARVMGELNPAEQPRALPALTRALDGLTAACGQMRLLQISPGSEPAAAVVAARRSWRAGAERELQSACRQLAVAATALGRARPPTCSPPGDAR